MTTEGAAPSGEKHREIARSVTTAWAMSRYGASMGGVPTGAFKELERLIHLALARVEAETLERAARRLEAAAAVRGPAAYPGEATLREDMYVRALLDAAREVRALTSERSEAP